MIIATYNSGRLGNRLFLGAFLIGLSIKLNKRLINLTFGEYCIYFNGTINNDCAIYPKPKVNVPFLRKALLYSIYRIGRLTHSMENCRIPSKFIYKSRLDFTKSISIEMIANEIGDSKSICIYNNLWHWYDHSDYTSSIKYIREFFEPINRIKNYYTSFMNELKSKSDIIVGIHIRRGDYIKWSKGVHYFSDKVYKEKMVEIRNLFPKKKVMFLICSDEKVNSDYFSNLNTVLGLGDAILDLYSLASCHYILGPQSTFSQWASFYGNVPLCKLSNNNKAITLNSFVIFKNRPKE